MQTIVSRTLSVHQEHELLLKLESAGLDAELAQKVIDARGNKLAKKLVRFLQNGDSPQDNSLARTILGDDYISPQEVAEARGVSYAAEQVQQLVDTLPTEEQLRWLKDNNYALVAGPPTEMSLLDIRSAETSLFYTKTGGWYAEQQPFAVNEKVGCTWLAIRKTEVPNSLNKKWDAQQKLLSKDEEVPNAAEMSWFITTYCEVRGVYLFKDVYVRTSSVALGDRRVDVGGFGGSGLCVSGGWGDYGCRSDLGVSASRKF